MNEYVGVLLITNNHTLILQKRDDNPNIVNPGLISTFGGLIEDRETLTEGILRELREETNLGVEERDLEFFKEFYKTENDGSKTKLSIFLIRNISEDNLKVYEGKGWIEISEMDNLLDLKLTDSAREIVTEYFN